MTNTFKQPYKAPQMSLSIIAIESIICASTGERFSQSQDYSSDWEEDD